MNALKHGLTSREVLMSDDDPAEYQRKFEAALRRHEPATDEEIQLVENIVNNEWRVSRANQLEVGFFEKGARELKEAADKIPNAADRRIFVRTETYSRYEKTLRNIYTLRNRFERQVEKDKKVLNQLIAERQRREAKMAREAKIEAQPGRENRATQPVSASTEPAAPLPDQQPLENEFGFVFTNDSENNCEPNLDDLTHPDFIDPEAS
jgi:hypothetical protein